MQYFYVNDKRVVTTTEAASLLGITRHAATSMIHRRRLPIFDVGNLLMVELDQILAIKKEREGAGS